MRPIRTFPVAPARSSVIVLVLVMLVFTATAVTAFIEKAETDLLVDFRHSQSKRLRREAFSALEVVLAVLEDFRQADNGLHSTAEGWGEPLAWAGWAPDEGLKVDVSFQDESGKIPLSRADMTTLTNLFAFWQVSPADSEKLADAILGWMQTGYVYTSVPPDYTDVPVPYAEPARPMRSFSELAAIDVAKDFFFDENGLPNAYFWRFVSDTSIFKYSQPNVNGANADVMASVGQYTDAQRQHINDYISGAGQYAQEGQQWFQNTTTLASVAGLGGNANPFSVTVSALRINITVHEGSTQYRLSAVVAPQGGATLNQTAATNATTAQGSTSSPTTSTSVTNSAQPSQTATSQATAAAASQSINYPFTLLEALEDDEIPQPPPESPPS
ncbi:MAG TPA: hypothetical protein VGF85_06115 [Opitutaceae bacterium]|jgi:general secretion pathway protein K